MVGDDDLDQYQPPVCRLQVKSRPPPEKARLILIPSTAGKLGHGLVLALVPEGVNSSREIRETVIKNILVPQTPREPASKKSVAAPPFARPALLRLCAW
jgi:hypothetical protein